MKIDKYLISLVLALGLYIPNIAVAACVDDYPMLTVTTEGGGQSASVNGSMTATFKGHIMTTDGLTNHGRNVVKICPGTTVDYDIKTTTGGGLRSLPDCSGLYPYGALAIGDKLSCNNKNVGGSDTDTYTVKAGR